MSMLTWDGTGDRLYETGVDRGVYYAMNDSGGPPPDKRRSAIRSVAGDSAA